MPETTEAIAVAPPTAPALVCDHEGCDELATVGYAWDWGQTGVCCARHQVELAQKAGVLKRSCQFSALAPTAPAPLQRDERVRLTAEALTLAAELEEAKERSANLYAQSRQLASQVHTLTARETEARAQLRDAQGELATEREAANELRAERGELVQELERLRLLVDAGDTQPGT